MLSFMGVISLSGNINAASLGSIANSGSVQASSQAGDAAPPSNMAMYVKYAEYAAGAAVSFFIIGKVYNLLFVAGHGYKP